VTWASIHGRSRRATGTFIGTPSLATCLRRMLALRRRSSLTSSRERGTCSYPSDALGGPIAAVGAAACGVAGVGSNRTRSWRRAVRRVTFGLSRPARGAESVGELGRHPNPPVRPLPNDFEAVVFTYERRPKCPSVVERSQCCLSW